MDLKETLQVRGKTHGDYSTVCAIAEGILSNLYCGNFAGLSSVQKQSLQMIAHKMGRIVCGDPNNPENWHDIAGYAKLAEDRLPCNAVITAVDMHRQQAMQETACAASPGPHRPSGY